jgi:hypothetical protein
MSIASGLRWSGAALAACMVLLSGCGPGVGGTGTGETGGGLEAFGALPASVCSGELAPIVACASPAGAAAPAPGAAAVFLADTIDGRQVRVTLRGNTVELSAGCVRVQFRGEWGAVAGQPGRYFGVADVDGTTAPAALQVQLSGGDVLLTLRDASGRVLLGPVLVRAVLTLSPPPSCG